MELNEYELVSGVGSKDFTDFITNEIFYNWNWIFSSDEKKFENRHRKEEEDRIISDTGALISSFDDRKTWDENNNNFKLNCFGDYIYQSILKKTKWEYKDTSLVRYYWNYYNVGSSGVFHTDIYEHNIINGQTHASILYNFSNDGGTIINEGGEIFIPSVSEEAIIFNSLALHRGVGPSKSKQRFALNIVFTYSERTLR